MISNRQVFLNHIAQTSTSPMLFEPVQAKGIYIYDKEGKQHIDLISGISVSNVGHCHPHVVKAIQKQAATYQHLMVYGEYVQSPQTELAHKINELLPNELDNIYFVNSGSEATEGALKIAKKHTGRKEIICFENAYHGSTHGALSLIGNEEYVDAFGPLLSHVKRIRNNEINDLQQITENTACVMIELVQGEAGIIATEKTYVKALRDRCNQTGTLLIVDEVQTGFGRTGKMFAFEHYGIVPDIITCAKGMGGGMPIGAFISRKEIMHTLTCEPILGHITTFGGHPVCCAAALANIEVLVEENLVSLISEKEALFHELLQHPLIKNIRSKGLMIGVDFGEMDTNFGIIAKCLEKGIITDWFLFNTTTMRIAPPLTITKEEIKQACSKILEAIDQFTKEQKLNND